MCSSPSLEVPVRERKRISVVIGSHPSKGKKAVEAARMAVGLTLRNPQVHLFLVGSGTKWLLEEAEEKAHLEFRKHLDALLEMGCPVVVERGKGASEETILWKEGVESWELPDIVKFVADSHVALLVED
jgi:predicted peroxiredoxin